jgi:hypothetical protein
LVEAKKMAGEASSDLIIKAKGAALQRSAILKVFEVKLRLFKVLDIKPLMEATGETEAIKDELFGRFPEFHNEKLEGTTFCLKNRLLDAKSKIMTKTGDMIIRTKNLNVQY